MKSRSSVVRLLAVVNRVDSGRIVAAIQSESGAIRLDFNADRTVVEFWLDRGRN